MRYIVRESRMWDQHFWAIFDTQFQEEIEGFANKYNADKRCEELNEAEKSRN